MEESKRSKNVCKVYTLMWSYFTHTLPLNLWFSTLQVTINIGRKGLTYGRWCSDTWMLGCGTWTLKSGRWTKGSDPWTLVTNICTLLFDIWTLVVWHTEVVIWHMDAGVQHIFYGRWWSSTWTFASERLINQNPEGLTQFRMRGPMGPNGFPHGACC